MIDHLGLFMIIYSIFILISFHGLYLSKIMIVTEIVNF